MALKINVFGTTDLCLDSKLNRLSCEKTLDPCSYMAGWQTKYGWISVCKILYRLNYLDFCFIDISAMLLIVLKVHFSRLFSNKVYFRACFEMRKIQLPFFSCQSLLLSTNALNDYYVATFLNWSINISTLIHYIHTYAYTAT